MHTHTLILMYLLGSASACAADEATAMRALRAQGFVDIQIGDYPFFECGNGDYFNSAFTARARGGLRVDGAVCCGLYKNCTVRIK